MANGPIALCEVQGYVYAAKRLASDCARRLGLAERASQLDAQADRLRAHFEQSFWCEERGTYALALDGNKLPCRVQSSNAGQVLFSGIASSDRAKRIAEALMTPECFSGWGVRTISTAERRYNPMSYHNGSVWPHDNALIALGLARYRAKNEVARIFRAQFDAATYLDLHRLPELFCGFSRFAGRGTHALPGGVCTSSMGCRCLLRFPPGIAGPQAGSLEKGNPLSDPDTAQFSRRGGVERIDRRSRQRRRHDQASRHEDIFGSLADAGQCRR